LRVPHGSSVKDTEDKNKIRLDRWLKAARLFKSRSGAKGACDAGRVKIGKNKAKPSASVGVGDTLSITRRGRITIYEVLGLTTKSLPAARARELYLEKEVVEKKGSELMRLIERAERHHTPWNRKGRPTKKERRRIDKIKGH